MNKCYEMIPYYIQHHKYFSCFFVEVRLAQANKLYGVGIYLFI